MRTLHYKFMIIKCCKYANTIRIFWIISVTTAVCIIKKMCVYHTLLISDFIYLYKCV